MHIGFVEPHLLTVGGIRRIIEIANRLLKRGHQVEIYTPPGRECFWLKNKVPVQKISKIPHRKFDILLFNLAEQYPIVAAAKAKVKVFWVLAPEAMYKIPDIPIRALNQGFHLIANSKFTEGYIRRHTHVTHDIPIIPGGINPAHFHYEPAMPKTYDILYYGSPRPWKGGQIVEQAFMNSRYKILKMHGKGTPQTELYRLYNSSTIFVSASLCEGFSFPQLEAMACGSLVVTTDDGGSRDYIKSGENAVVVVRNPEKIAEGVRLVLQSKKLQRTIRRNGLKTAAQKKFDWNHVTGRVEDVFNKLLNG